MRLKSQRILAATGAPPLPPLNPVTYTGWLLSQDGYTAVTGEGSRRFCLIRMGSFRLGFSPYLTFRSGEGSAETLPLFCVWRKLWRKLILRSRIFVAPPPPPPPLSTVLVWLRAGVARFAELPLLATCPRGSLPPAPPTGTRKRMSRFSLLTCTIVTVLAGGFALLGRRATVVRGVLCGLCSALVLRTTAFAPGVGFLGRMGGVFALGASCPVRSGAPHTRSQGPILGGTLHWSMLGWSLKAAMPSEAPLPKRALKNMGLRPQEGAGPVL